MGMGFSTSKPKHGDSVNGFEIGLKPGLAIKLNDSFSFITKVGLPVIVMIISEELMALVLLWMEKISQSVSIMSFNQNG